MYKLNDEIIDLLSRLFQWKTDLEEILLLATQDTDQWVSMIGEILKTFPSMGTLNLDLEDNGIFADMTSDLNKAGKYISV